VNSFHETIIEIANFNLSYILESVREHTHILVLCVISVLVLIFIAQEKKKKKSTPHPSSNPLPIPSPLNISRQHFPYRLKNSLLTKREIEFYKALRPIAKKYSLSVAIKPRIADFVEVTVPQYKRGSGFWGYFNKISAKHVDFLLCDVTSFTPRLAVELDDSTHDSSYDRKYRDLYVNEVYAAAGLPIIHIREYDAEYLDKLISETLGVTHPEDTTTAATV
jgi:hypothetical protein